MIDRARSLPWRTVSAAAGLVLGSVLVGLVFVAIQHQGREISTLQETSQANTDAAIINGEAATENGEKVDELAGVVRALQDQLLAAGEEPVVPEDPSDIVDQPRQPVSPAEPSNDPVIVTRPPSEAEMRAVAEDVIRDNPTFISGQVAAAVTGYFVRNPPPAGPDGEPGEDASPEQIAAAVATFCGGDTSPCRGTQGIPGADGAPGVDGEDGAPGEDGADGRDGSPGRGIVAVTCNVETGVWTVEFDQDPTAVEVPGPCVGEQGPRGEPGPACPDGYFLETWEVTAAGQISGLEPGTYQVCRLEEGDTQG